MNRPLIVKPNVIPTAPSGLVAVDRAIAELRRGAMVFVGDAIAGGALVLSSEAVSARSLRKLAERTGRPPEVVVTSRRAGALGIAADPSRPVVLIDIDGDLSAEDVQRLANPFGPPIQPTAFRAMHEEPPAWAHAAVTLAKLSRLLPAVVAAVCHTVPEGLYAVSSKDILAYPARAANELRRVAEARVPLADAEDCRVVAFRPCDGGIEHLAIIVGQPNRDQPVLTRLHSECFTGDLLGSLRCDCGDQLRGAIARLAREGGGVLLYLAQEGRGIGLINKLHAYGLQDAGLDTLDANQQLGFDDDERIYLPAAEMLKLLGIERVRLLTNNPAKVDGLVRHGIPVSERVPHVIPANGHNESYLRTKAKRSGHIL